MKQVLVALSLAAASAGPADKFNTTILKNENATRKEEGRVALDGKVNHYGEVLYNAQRSICPTITELTAKLDNEKARILLLETAKDYYTVGCRECAQMIYNFNNKSELIHPAEFGRTERCQKIIGAGLDAKLANAHDNDKFDIKDGAEGMQAYICNYIREKTDKMGETETAKFVSELGWKYRSDGCYECNQIVYGINLKYGPKREIKHMITTGDQCEKYIAAGVKKILGRREIYDAPRPPHPTYVQLNMQGGVDEVEKSLCPYIADFSFLETRDKSYKKLEQLHKAYMTPKFSCPQCAEAVKVITVESEEAPDLYHYARSGKCKSAVEKTIKSVPANAGENFKADGGALLVMKELCPYIVKQTGGMNDKQEAAFLKKLSVDFTKAGCPGCAEAVEAIPEDIAASGKSTISRYAASSRCQSLVKDVITQSIKLDVTKGLEGMDRFCQYVGVKTGEWTDDAKAKDWFDRLGNKYRSAGCNECADVVYQLYQKATPNIQFYTHSQECIKTVDALTKKAMNNNKYALEIKDGLVSMPTNLCGFIAEKTEKLNGNQQYSVTLKLADQYAASGCDRCIKVLDELTKKAVKEGGLHKFTSSKECDAFVLKEARAADGGVIRN
eukprot:GDKJ01049672.1.p1 GENE.GDKJ01049672.1~~GDKJ01049672.1.p1  ORF type:complete len:615 (+),score=175.16 GDKJ01049672.1:22-1866(+)